MPDQIITMAVYKAELDSSGYEAGANRVIQKSNDVSATVDKVTESTSKVNRATIASADAYDRMLAKLNPLVAQSEQYQRQLDQINRLETAGFAGGQQKQVLLDALNTKYASLTGSVNASAAANDNHISTFNRLGGVLGNVNQLLGTFGLALGIDRIVEWTKSTIESAAALERQAKVLGVSTDQLQAYHAAAVLSGADAEAGDRALTILTRNLGQAQEAAGPARKALIELFGGDVQAAFGAVAGGPQAAVPKIASDLLNVHDSAERLRLEFVLMGRSGAESAAFLEKWADPAIVQNMKEMGFVLDEQLIKKAHDMEVAWNAGWLQFKVSAFAAISDVVDYINQHMPGLLSADTARTAAGASAGGLIGGLIGNVPGAIVGSAIGGVIAHGGSGPAAVTDPNFAPGGKYNPASGDLLTGNAVVQTPTGNNSWASQTQDLANYIDKLKEASTLAGELPRQREIDLKLIEAGAAAQKDYVANLERTTSSQDTINAAKAVEITTVQQAIKLLGDQKAAQVENLVVQAQWNTLEGQGIKGVDDIIAGLKAHGVVLDDTLKQALQRISEIRAQANSGSSLFAPGAEDASRWNAELTNLTKQSLVHADIIKQQIEENNNLDIAGLKTVSEGQAAIANLQEQIRLAGLSTAQRQAESAVMRDMNMRGVTQDEKDILAGMEPILEAAKQWRSVVDGIQTPMEELPATFINDPAIVGEIETALQEILA